VELQGINKELQRSNQNLEEFAHAASHDLKEPIRKIQFFTDQLRSQLSERLNESEKHTFNRIENASKRMGALIDDLLLFSHVSSKPHAKEVVDLNERVKRVLEDLELEVQLKSATITINPLPIVKGYRRQLQQLFQNLIGNALKYSKPGIAPIITITSTELGDENAWLKLPEAGQQKLFYCIEVKDNGIGFEQNEAERIFHMFHRLHGNAEYRGTGVGLSIARKVVENHNGKIIAESEPGMGAAFKVYLPV
jgi:light-regulated signal transduction histidine kinase (bacteriophytochrome)